VTASPPAGAKPIATRLDEAALLQRAAAAAEALPADSGGGASAGKAQVLAWLIARYDLQVTVDIGVYRGRSLLPQAVAHRFCTGGMVYGIDPWSLADALQSDLRGLRPVLAGWEREVDLDATYEAVVAALAEAGLQEHCTLLRATSRDALEWLRRGAALFDLVHVDGGHDSATVLRDVRDVLPRLRAGGFLVLDDVSWPSVHPAYALAARHLDVLHQRSTATDDFAVLRRRGSRLELAELRAMLPHVGRAR
jgi:hypothetical protein